jgi:glycosyltransferase involved in cell wall biosynthesis
MSKPEISIIVITKNDPEIETTLNALASIDSPASQEIIVIDGSASKSTLYPIRKKFATKVQWYYYQNSLNKRFTFSQQRNLGLSRATGKYVLFLDCGCIPKQDWLIQIYGTLQQPRVLAGSILSSTGRSSAYGMQRANQGEIGVSDVAANGMGAEKITFIKLGCFDEHFTYGEDTDICWRATKAGYELVRNTDAIIYHDWGSLKSEIKRAFRYGAARSKLYKRHPDHWRHLLGDDLNVLIYSTYILFLPVTILVPYYPAILLLVILKNIRKSPLMITASNLIYGLGVIKGALTPGYTV